MKQLSHLDERRHPHMVDVSAKARSLRTARATGFIRLAPETVELVKKDALAKGNVLVCAELAGIQAAKETSRLIPLCHPLPLTRIAAECTLGPEGVTVCSVVRCAGRTGVEMEALTAVSVALLTVYDMCKAVDSGMVITDIRLLEKTKVAMSETAEAAAAVPVAEPAHGDGRPTS
jgi:cyclic pyranopterin phosphate synthase